MDFVKAKCIRCGAQLDIDLENLQGSCPYCGQKLTIDIDQLGEVLAEKEKTKRTLAQEEAETKRTQMAYEHESKENARKGKHNIILIGIMFIVLILCFVLPQIPHNKKVANLQGIEKEIEDAIVLEDYDLALLKANQLYCDDGWSSDETKAWDLKREAYIKLIQEKKQESEMNNPDTIFMPADSSQYKGKKYLDVVDQLSTLGFTNVTTQKSTKNSGLFNKAETVEHILVGGKTDFTDEDYFNKDVPIIVYYYEK